jgi:putative nucleotide binding protein
MDMEGGREEWAIVLDFLPNGYLFDKRPSHLKTPIVQAIGKVHLALLELVPKKDISLQPHENIYIGDGKRDKIHHIIGKMPYERLTSTASTELEFILTEIITANEKECIDFFNKAMPLTTRMHSLELMPGLGKKRMWEILEEREKAPFASFADLKQRVKLMPDPKTVIIRRIIKELQGNEKHYFFVRNSPNI